jgi:hypothetical protein
MGEAGASLYELVTGRGFPELPSHTGPGSTFIPAPGTQTPFVPGGVVTQGAPTPEQLAEQRALELAQGGDFERDPRFDFQAPIYLNSEEVAQHFLQLHPEVLEGDFSQLSIAQIAMLDHFGMIDPFGEDEAVPAPTYEDGGYGGYGGGYGGYGGGGGGGAYNPYVYPRSNDVYMGLVKWRI